jgi:hypothetical protein
LDYKGLKDADKAECERLDAERRMQAEEQERNHVEARQAALERMSSSDGSNIPPVKRRKVSDDSLFLRMMDQQMQIEEERAKRQEDLMCQQLEQQDRILREQSSERTQFFQVQQCMLELIRTMNEPLKKKTNGIILYS